MSLPEHDKSYMSKTEMYENIVTLLGGRVAEKLILDLLADGKEFASEDIEKAAADAGISARTVRAAKKNLDGRITSKRIGAAWYHALKK